jgi:hypothetical protein
MMHGMNDMSWGMGWGMGLIGLLVVIVLVLGIAALVKYLFSSCETALKWIPLPKRSKRLM